MKRNYCQIDGTLITLLLSTEIREGRRRSSTNTKTYVCSINENFRQLTNKKAFVVRCVASNYRYHHVWHIQIDHPSGSLDLFGSDLRLWILLLECDFISSYNVTLHIILHMHNVNE